MNLQLEINKSLQKDSYPQDVTLSDIVKRPCTYQQYLRFLGEETVSLEPANRIALRKLSVGLREMVQKYLSGCYGARYQEGFSKKLNEVIEVNFDGVIDGDVLVEIVPLPDKTFNTITERRRLPPWVVETVATKAHLLNKESALVITMNRNSLKWSCWNVTENFEDTAKAVLRKVLYFQKLVEGSAELSGVESECRSCPYASVCDAHRGNPHPQVKSKVGVAPEFGVAKVLDTYLVGLNNKPSGRSTHCIHPSEFSISECDRRIAYGLVGEKTKPKIGAGLRRIFDAGHSVHEVIQTALEDVFGDEVVIEAEVDDPDLKIHGHCDGMFESTGFEIKSISYKGFDKLSNAKSDHQKQGTLYGSILNLKEMQYIYINKDTGEIACYNVPIDKKLWHRLAGRAERIINTVEADKMPPTIDKDYVCRTCPYQWKCKPRL
tara:strand:+ start:24453 stop:25757 length:1305 start_codon:yes stop_codon:yes gene_type:complete